MSWNKETMVRLVTELVHEIMEERRQKDYRYDRKQLFIIEKHKEEWLPIIKSYKTRMDEIQASMNANAIGLQNVYDEMQKLKASVKKKLRITDE